VSAARRTSFLLSFPDITLEVDEVWPDHDAPEHPTAADVVQQMRKTGSVGRVLSEWALEPIEIEVFGNHDASSAVFRS
jgi:hypothetical protein